MALLTSVMKDYTRGMEESAGYHVYDMWFKKAAAVSPPFDHIPAKVFNTLRAKYWVAHPVEFPRNQFPKLTSKDCDAFNTHTPFTDIAEFHSGSVWTIACKDYMADIRRGNVPHMTKDNIAVIDCRSDNRPEARDTYGFMRDIHDGTSAPFPGPWPPGTNFMQFNTNAANTINRNGMLTKEAARHIKEFYAFVLENTFNGKQIIFYCNQGQFRSVAAAAACLKHFIPEPYQFLNKLRPIAHPDLPFEHGNDDKPAPQNKALWVHVVGEQLPYLDTLFAKGGRWCLPLQKLGVVSFQCATQLLQEAMSKEAARPLHYRSIFKETLALDSRIRTCHSRHDQQQLLLNSPAWPRAFGSVACSPPEFVQPPSGASTSRLPDAVVTVTSEEPPNEYPLADLTAGPAEPAATTSIDPSVVPAERLADPSATNPPDDVAASLPEVLIRNYFHYYYY